MLIDSVDRLVDLEKSLELFGGAAPELFLAHPQEVRPQIEKPLPVPACGT